MCNVAMINTVLVLSCTAHAAAPNETGARSAGETITQDLCQTRVTTCRPAEIDVIGLYRVRSGGCENCWNRFAEERSIDAGRFLLVGLKQGSSLH